MRLIELLPNFISELQIACEQLGRHDLHEQLETVELDNNSYSVETRVTQLRLRPGRTLDLPAKPAPDAHAELPPPNESVTLRHRYGVKAETDNIGRLRKLIVKDGTDIAQALGKFSPLRQ